MKNTVTDEGDDWIKIPKDLLPQKGNNAKQEIVQTVYPNLLQRYRERDFLEERAILCPRNETIREINEQIMSQIQGEEVTYLSLDTVCKTTSNNIRTETCVQLCSSTT
jgi:ATP-dependent DNA helicase PIF1